MTDGVGYIHEYSVRAFFWEYVVELVIKLTKNVQAGYNDSKMISSASAYIDFFQDKMSMSLLGH